MLSSLILFEQVKTTTPKGKALKGEMQSLITRLKSMDNEVNAKRYLASTLYGGAKEKAYDFKDSYKDVRIFRLQKRLGDGADTVLVQLVKLEVKPETAKLEKSVSVKKDKKVKTGEKK